MKFKEWLEEVKKDNVIAGQHKSSLSYYSSQEIELYEIIFNAGVKEGKKEVSK